MLHFYVIRHGDAVPHGDPGYADDDRPLTELGRRQSRALGEALTNHGVRFDVILCSPLPRARETADGVIEGLADPKPPIVYTTALAPGGKSRKLDREVLKHGGAVVAVIGHQPDLGEYTARLIGSKKTNIDLAKASVACVKCTDPPGKGCGSLELLIVPEWYGITS
jgi:phosphohistidine phosphatase